jgi:pyruvate dehydrogenase E2 component (dihydrolipoamide acetyltransferase)
MLKEFRLPDLGEGLTESEVVAWRVAVGDHIELNQIIADIETAKAVVELPSPYSGTVAALFVEAGDTVDVGAPLLSFDVPTPGSAPDPDDDAEPNLVGYGAKTESTIARRRSRNLPDSVGERPRSTPPVRKLARTLGIELAAVRGTGELGRITRADVVRAEASSSAANGSGGNDGEPIVADPAQGDVRIPIKGVRKATAAAMVASAFTAPHVTEFLTLDVTATLEFIERLKADRSFAGHRISLLTICSKAVCIALARNPSLNSRWDEAHQQIVQLAAVNLGIAAATQRGLVVPNITNAGSLALGALADALTDLTVTARAGSTSPAALRGGTFTITNIGVFGIDAGTPILNPGESGILALGAVRRTPWEHQGAVALRDVLTLSLSFDHRVVDGAEGSRFLSEVGAILRDPAHVLALI